MQSTKVNDKKWALITGASAGIGAAFARQIARQGFHVVLVARRRERLLELSREIEQETGKECRIVTADLRRSADVTSLIAELARDRIEIDLLFNNAGYGTNGALCDLDIERELEMIDLNCRALVALTHAVSRQMRQRGRGSIIHTASVGGLSPTPFFATYGATKAFIIAFSEALGEELRPHGIRVYTLCPGVTQSEFETVAGFRGAQPPKFAFESSEQVAATAIKALGTSKTLIVSGRLNRFMALLARFLPRRTNLRIAAKAMKPIA